MRECRSRLASSEATSCGPDLPPDVITNMNAYPFEHAKPAVTLIERFYGNLLEFVRGVC